MRKASLVLAAGTLGLFLCQDNSRDLIIAIILAFIVLGALVLGILFYLGVADFQEYEE